MQHYIPSGAFTPKGTPGAHDGPLGGAQRAAESLNKRL